jgi:hypothetical protein
MGLTSRKAANMLISGRIEGRRGHRALFLIEAGDELRLDLKTHCWCVLLKGHTHPVYYAASYDGAEKHRGVVGSHATTQVVHMKDLTKEQQVCPDESTKAPESSISSSKRT